MKALIVKVSMLCLSLLWWNVATSAATVQKCVDAKGAITFAERCTTNQQAIDTGVVIDDRSEKQKTEDAANNKKYLDDLEKQSNITPTSTVAPVAQPNPADTELAPTETVNDDDNDSYDCLSSSRNCLSNNVSNLTPAQKAVILNRKKAVQLPTRTKRR